MKVALGGRDLRVPDRHREPHDVTAVVQVVRRKLVAQAMLKRAGNLGERVM
jgi:hypothetical protein